LSLRKAAKELFRGGEVVEETDFTKGGSKLLPHTERIGGRREGGETILWRKGRSWNVKVSASCRRKFGRADWVWK